MAYDNILLDADMTLLDFDSAEHEALCRVLQARGLPTDKETTDAYVRINWALWSAYNRGEISQDEIAATRFAQLFHLLGFSGDALACNRDYQLALADCGQLLPGALDFCRQLYHAGKTLAIATNGMPLSQWGRFRKSGLQPYIQRMYVSGEIGCQKPQKAFFAHIFRDLPVPDLARCAIFGDGLGSDIQGGRNAGIATVWYNPNHWPGDPEITPDFEEHSYDAALAFLLRE